jgi:hypothetical protein
VVGHQLVGGLVPGDVARPADQTPLTHSKAIWRLSEQQSDTRSGQTEVAQQAHSLRRMSCRSAEPRLGVGTSVGSSAWNSGGNILAAERLAGDRPETVGCRARILARPDHPKLRVWPLRGTGHLSIGSTVKGASA